MNIALWIAAGLLALLPSAAGSARPSCPGELLAQPGGEWTQGVSAGFLKTLGCLELLSVVGLILPAVLDIAPVMVPTMAPSAVFSPSPER